MSSIIVNGQVIDALTHRGVKSLQIVNLKNISRFYGDSSGNFVLQAGKEDSLVFVAKGYQTSYLCYKDSPSQKIYTLTLKMNKVSVELPEITVKSEREFGQVHKDAQKLGYNQRDYMVHGYQILQSPFTYLYQLLSTKEKDKREYAELMNDDRKRQLVEELINNYMSLGILRIDPSEAHDFANYVQVPEDFLKTVSEYDFILYLEIQLDAYHKRGLAPVQTH